MASRATRKITVVLPKDLLDRAVKATGLGLTPTIRKGLESLATAAAFDHLLKMQGKLKLNLNVEELREDR